jgi:hypothetical protein
MSTRTAPRYVSLHDIARQAERSYGWVYELAKKGFIPGLERPPGVKGYRITASKANRFLARHWPSAPLFEE